MSSFPGSPRMLKGAIVGVDSSNPTTNVILFQYNPDTLTRSLQPQGAGDTGARMEPQRLKGAPIETIKLDIEIDATDQLETGDSNASSMGIFPTLSALETLTYPRSSQVIANTSLLATGTIEIVPLSGVFTLFVWGPRRVLPVRITEFSITEEAFDVNLNPIRARVSLGLRVLNYNDLPVSHPGYSLFLAHHTVKEAMAVVGGNNNLSNAVNGNIKLS